MTGYIVGGGAALVALVLGYLAGQADTIGIEALLARFRRSR